MNQLTSLNWILKFSTHKEFETETDREKRNRSISDSSWNERPSNRMATLFCCQLLSNSHSMFSKYRNRTKKCTPNDNHGFSVVIHNSSSRPVLCWPHRLQLYLRPYDMHPAVEPRLLLFTVRFLRINVRLTNANSGQSTQRRQKNLNYLWPFIIRPFCFML